MAAGRHRGRTAGAAESPCGCGSAPASRPPAPPLLTPRLPSPVHTARSPTPRPTPRPHRLLSHSSVYASGSWSPPSTPCPHLPLPVHAARSPSPAATIGTASPPPRASSAPCGQPTTTPTMSRHRPPASGAAQFPERIATRSPDPIPLCTFQRQVKPRAPSPPPAPRAAPAGWPRAAPAPAGPGPAARHPPRSSRHADCSLLHSPAAGAVGDQSQNPAGFPGAAPGSPCAARARQPRAWRSGPAALPAARAGLARPWARAGGFSAPAPARGPAPGRPRRRRPLVMSLPCWARSRDRTGTPGPLPPRLGKRAPRPRDGPSRPPRAPLTPCL